MLKNNDGQCKVLCFYLPQFHITPENNKWWGEGYTEWTAVRNAKLYFRKHRQPRKPLNNNYYDLSDESGAVWKWQSELAKKYGVYGFVIYHYWFGGKKVLQRPAEILLNHPEIDIHYSFSWDNNEWKRTWYSTREEILIPQDYGDAHMWRRHFEDLLPYFKDERYIKIDNKPVFHIYASNRVPDIGAMKELWDQMAKENGFDGIYLVGGDLCRRNNHESLDAYYNFEPNRIQMGSQYSPILIPMIDITGGLRKRFNRLFKTHKLDIRSTSLLYKLIAKESKKEPKKTYKGIFVDYDDTPRRLEKGIVYLGGNPRAFYETLLKILRSSQEQGKEFVYINAWNEWGEGAYLEPDEENRYQYLTAVKRAVEQLRQEHGRTK
ncbi:MAG: glycoside hydrolase family 99-like domain-containing protein [Lachnospiraceae bacterium]|nr:glycoside hydrolase family 99-like domain-containing protein [Lachnospiraceae bacterium]